MLGSSEPRGINGRGAAAGRKRLRFGAGSDMAQSGTKPGITRYHVDSRIYLQLGRMTLPEPKILRGSQVQHLEYRPGTIR